MEQYRVSGLAGDAAARRLVGISYEPRPALREKPPAQPVSAVMTKGKSHHVSVGTTLGGGRASAATAPHREACCGGTAQYNLKGPDYR